MGEPVYDRWGVSVFHGDNLDVLRDMPDCSVDSVVTDPPAGIAFMGKAWDADRGGRREWVAWLTERMVETRRVLKPGGHALVWSMPRTSHWTGWALEDAGFEVRDTVQHLFGKGMPKSKAHLKPAAETWWLVRKPVTGSVAANVARLGTGHLGVDACRVAHDESVDLSHQQRHLTDSARMTQLGGSGFQANHQQATYNPDGRWPANVLISHSPLCKETSWPMQPGSTERSTTAPTSDTSATSTPTPGAGTAPKDTSAPTRWKCASQCPAAVIDENGLASPSRTFTNFAWHEKAGVQERPVVDGAVHPTVKSVALCRWLVRLVTPPGGTVLDLFAGTGPVGQAARAEGMKAILIEQDAQSIGFIRARLDARAKTEAGAAGGDGEPLDLLDLLGGDAS